MLVPFEQGKEAEQRLRAERIAARGLAEIVGETDLVGPGARRGGATAPCVAPPDATPARVSAALPRPAAPSRPSAVGRDRRREAWARLDAALDAAREAGRILRVWWRDDDVCSPSPALDRLLALARRYDVPVALAAYPWPSMPASPNGSPASRSRPCSCTATPIPDHAPLGNKPRELGHRPADIAGDELAEALRHMPTSSAGAPAGDGAALEQIDGALVARLAPIGFRGLSARHP